MVLHTDTDHSCVRTTRDGTVSPSENNKDNYQSYLQSKLSDNNRLEPQKQLKEGFSQTDFQDDLEQEIVLGQYLESKLGQDLSDLRVKLKHQTSETLTRQPPPEIVIVEFDPEEEII